MSANIILTDHGKKRLSERMNIPKRAMQRQLQKAWEEGETIQYSRERKEGIEGDEYYFKVVKRASNKDFLFFEYPNKVVAFCTILTEKEMSAKVFTKGKPRNTSKRYVLL